MDFWATWCGPCKACFSWMQKLLMACKDNSDVKFLFVNSREERNAKIDADEKKFKEVVDYINQNKYSFQVLMDNVSNRKLHYILYHLPACLPQAEGRYTAGRLDWSITDIQ